MGRVRLEVNKRGENQEVGRKSGGFIAERAEGDGIIRTSHN